MRAIIISASSDIGVELCKEWHEYGWSIAGTFRTASPALEDLKNFVELHHCDLRSVESVERCCLELKKEPWDALVFAPGNLEPIGDFKEVDFDKWEEGIQVNLLRQLRILHRLLQKRNLSTTLPQPTVLFFAGGGTNNAVLHYSSYTLSKIALIKMCELLDAEIPDTRFVIVGPGVVKTKIHEPTLKYGATLAKTSYQKTVDRLQKDECTPMKEVIKCCSWLIKTPCRAVRGRNFSTASDKWGTKDLEKMLEKDGDMYKLRRHGNSWKP